MLGDRSSPGEAPEAFFEGAALNAMAYAVCNLHEVWCTGRAQPGGAGSVGRQNQWSHAADQDGGQ